MIRNSFYFLENIKSAAWMSEYRYLHEIPRSLPFLLHQTPSKHLFELPFVSVMKISWTISHYSLSVAAESVTLPDLLRKLTIFVRLFVDLTVLPKT